MIINLILKRRDNCYFYLFYINPNQADKVDEKSFSLLSPLSLSLSPSAREREGRERESYRDKAK